MTTSANVVEYRVLKDGEIVGKHRQHGLCKTHWDELCKFIPMDNHEIQAFGYDEEESYWENDPVNLQAFLLRIAECGGLRKLKVVGDTLRWVNNFNGKMSGNVHPRARAIMMFHKGEIKWKS